MSLRTASVVAVVVEAAVAAVVAVHVHPAEEEEERDRVSVEAAVVHGPVSVGAEVVRDRVAVAVRDLEVAEEDWGPVNHVPIQEALPVSVEVIALLPAEVPSDQDPVVREPAAART